MPKAKNGDTVSIHYTGKFEDGSVFETSKQGESLQFTIGEGKIIPGLEKAVIGMSPNEKKDIKVPAKEAYGPYYPDMVFEVQKKELPKGVKPELGQQFELEKDGETLIVSVIEIKKNSLVLDGNHPLAGHELHFEVELLEIL